ncbi:MAG: DNA-binding response regulator [Planctomycetota bacterium]|nr:MAG: DNA-binding response regulator [Planctomycetota bacterium]
MKVLIADDHGIVRDGLRALIEKHPDWEVVGEAEDGQKAVQLAVELLPDIVIMDVAMPNLNGIEATRQIVDKLPSVRVVALSMHSTRHFVVDMLKAGASGYVLKACLFDDLVNAMETVMTGEVYLSPRIASMVVDDYVNDVSQDNVPISSILTNREREVVQLLAEGKSVKQIAMQLHLSAKTIDANRRQVMDKLNIHNVAELTKYAICNGLTSIEF